MSDEGGRARVTEVVMPQGGRSGEASTLHWLRNFGVEVPATIVEKNRTLHQLVLNKKTQSIKFNRAIIVVSVLVNKKQITN